MRQPHRDCFADGRPGKPGRSAFPELLCGPGGRRTVQTVDVHLVYTPWLDHDGNRFLTREPLRLLGGHSVHRCAERSLARYCDWLVGCLRLGGPERPGELAARLLDHSIIQTVCAPHGSGRLWLVDLGEPRAGNIHSEVHVVRGTSTDAALLTRELFIERHASLGVQHLMTQAELYAMRTRILPVDGDEVPDDDQ